VQSAAAALLSVIYEADFLDCSYGYRPQRDALQAVRELTDALHRGQPTVKRRTSRKKLRGAVQRFTEWIKAERHNPLGELMDTLRAKYRGYWNYYGIIGNSESLNRYHRETSRILFKWLNRRSQRHSFTWRTFHRLLERFKVPPPRVVEQARGPLGLPCRSG
jgi:tagatose-1,6-bisphosphate aldolase non-catalytic subunit AgaZ/GatZ